jgi:hypothetical protein
MRRLKSVEKTAQERSSNKKGDKFILILDKESRLGLETLAQEYNTDKATYVRMLIKKAFRQYKRYGDDPVFSLLPRNLQKLGKEDKMNFQNPKYIDEDVIKTPQEAMELDNMGITGEPVQKIAKLMNPTDEEDVF